jgi:hypothetical protein
MRIVRAGTTISAYLNGSPTPFWSESHNTSPLVYFALALNKNSTSVATEVTWTDFSITPAPTLNPVITSHGLSDGVFSMSWQGTAQVPVIVERSTSLSGADWTTVSSGNMDRWFADVSPPVGHAFYRIRVPLD